MSAIYGVCAKSTEQKFVKLNRAPMASGQWLA